MANDFNASLVISTSDAVNSIRNVDSASKDLDKTLLALHSTMGKTQGDMDKITKSLKDFTVAQGQSAQNSKTRTDNLIREARAEREGIVTKSKNNDELRKQAINEAKLQGIRAGGGRSSASALAAETRRNQESSTRQANQTVLTTARATTESERYTAAQHRTAGALATRSAAEDRAATSAIRLQGAQDRANNSSLALNDSLSNSRYLLYDVAQTYAVLSAALLAIPVATTAVAASYEKDFAQVLRTTGIAKEDSAGLRNELKALGTQIPLSFGEFANIASIAGQLGIAEAKVGAFTETVAKFGAASNVATADAATAFGRLENSFNQAGDIHDFFNRIGSAIAKVGVESAASESEIIAVTNQISAAGAQFGFTADQVVGLSGALASVRIRPELARGAFQRIMLQLSRAADEGSASFDQFGKYTGLAADKSQALFKQDPSAFFNQYIAGIKGTIDKGTSVSAVLDDIGAKNVFDKQFILGLANGIGVYNKALGDSKTAFQDGTFLSESTAGVFTTFAATLTKIGTTLSNLGDSLGKGNLQPLTHMAETVLGVVGAFDRLITQQPIIAGVINGLLAVGAVTGVFLAFKAAQAFVLAGLVGLQQVMGRTSIAAGLTLRGNISELAKTMLMARGATAELATAMLAGKTTIQQMGIAITATSTSLARYSVTAEGAAVATSATAVAATRGAAAMRGFRGALSLVGGPIGAMVIGLGVVVTSLIAAEEKAQQAGDSIARAMKEGADSGNRAIADSLTQRTVDSWIGDMGSGGLSNHGKNVRQVAKDIGVDFNSIVASVAKGTDATKEFQKVQDAFAVGKGFKDFADLQANSTNLQNSKGEMQFLTNVVKELGDKSANSSEDVKATDDAVAKLGGAASKAAPEAGEFEAGLDGVGSAADKAADKITKAVDAIFGLADAEAATQDSLSKLGAGLQDSTDLGTGTEGGRSNLSNFHDALRSAAQEQQNLINKTGKTTQQASADYAAFVTGLMSELASKGVDVAQVQALADQAKGIFGTTFASGAQPKITPKVEAGPVLTEVALTKDNVQTLISANKPMLQIGLDDGSAQYRMVVLAQSLAQITGLPYQVVLDALTDPAHEKSVEIYNLMTSITDRTYVAPIGADTSAAISNVQNFSNYARAELASLQNAYNNVLAMSQKGSAGTGFLRQSADYALGKGYMGTGAQSYFGPSPAASKAAAPVATAAAAPPAIAQPNFGALQNGYNDAAKAAKGAGDAGKKAGEDMANGIDDATAAADDYASRLKTGLQSAFEKQYGMQKATDDYHSALNAITKKRKEELTQLDDLIAKQKELNNSRKEDLTSARKAGTEKAISEKYGETGRAQDYAEQEQKALDAAAAKKIDIDANNKTSESLRNGIDKFTGYSDAAIANREALRNLESKMLDMISAYAATGKTQEQVRAYAMKLTAQFQRDVNQVWNNRVAINALTGEMSRYVAVVNSVPQHKATKVTADTGGAMGGIQGVANALNGLKDRDVVVRMHGGMVFDNNYTSDNQPIYRTLDNDGNRTNVRLFNKGGEVPGFAGGGMIGGNSPSNPKVDNKFAQVDGKGMIKVRSGEFIVQQPAVDYWGLDFFKNLNNMKMPAFNAGGPIGGGNSGGAGSNGPVLVELTAENIAAIQRLPMVNLYADSTKIASSVNDGNMILASQGAN